MQNGDLHGGETTSSSEQGRSDDAVSFDSREQLQLNELREARIRAVQMEKTMRWWSDCTANWREKWGQVKNERNKAREDLKTLKQKLHDANAEIYQLKRERNEFRAGNEQLRKDVEKMAAELKRDRRAFVAPLRIAENGHETQVKQHAGSNREMIEFIAKATSGDDVAKSIIAQASLLTDAKEFVEIKKARDSKEEEDTLRHESSDGKETHRDGRSDLRRNNKEEEDGTKKELERLKEKLQLAEDKVTEERRMNESVTEATNELRKEIEVLKGSLEDEKSDKENLVNELNQLKEEHEMNNTERLLATNARVAYSTDSVDRKVKDLRLEIERLQKENSTEWNKREKLETQKLSVERENKKLRHEITDLQNELRSKVNDVNQTADTKLKQLQKDLDEKKKEMSELKLTHLKLKKIYQDKKEDVFHNKTRVDQHEDEIKKLRGRIDELKMKLTAAEDEVDHKENLVRKLQRQLDDQTQQCHVLRVQMEHLQTRWIKMSKGNRTLKRGDRNSHKDDEDFLEIDF